MMWCTFSNEQFDMYRDAIITITHWSIYTLNICMVHSLVEGIMPFAPSAMQTHASMLDSFGKICTQQYTSYSPKHFCVVICRYGFIDDYLHICDPYKWKSRNIWTWEIPLFAEVCTYAQKLHVQIFRFEKFFCNWKAAKIFHFPSSCVPE